MIETSQLQTLVTVAHANSFSRAAEHLNVTQSAISQSIKNLERKLNTSLFKRSGKKVVLTPEGEKLFQLASSFLGNMEDTLDEIKYARDKMNGKVRVGTLNGVGKSWLVPELFKFAREYEDLKVFIKMGYQDKLIRDFIDFQLDFLILPEESLPNIGEKLFLSEERSTLVFPKKHPKFDIGENITAEDLERFPTVFFEKDDHLYLNWFKTRFSHYPKKVNVRYSVNSHGHMLQAVFDGMGVAVIPTHVLYRSYLKDKVETLGQDFEVTNYKLYLAYHEENENVMRIKKALEYLLRRKNPLV